MVTLTLTMILLAPLAIGLAFAYIGTHLAHASTLPYPPFTDAEFDFAHDHYMATISAEGYNR